MIGSRAYNYWLCFIKNEVQSRVGYKKDAYIMAISVVEFSKEGYKIRKVFG